MDAIPLLLIGAQGVAVVSLLVRGLGGPFLFLILYLAWSMLRGGILMAGSTGLGSADYSRIFFTTLPVSVMLQILIGSEAYRRSTSEVPGASRNLHLGMLSVWLLAAALAQLAQNQYGGEWVIGRAQQAIAMVLGLQSLGVSAWIGYLKPVRRRNDIIHERIVTFHFVGLAVVALLVIRGYAVGVANAGISIACCLAWATLLSQSGERPPKSGGTRHGDDDAARQLGRTSRSVWAFVRER